MELHVLLPKTISFLKESLNLAEEDMPVPIRSAAEKFNMFIKDTLLPEDDKTEGLFDALQQNDDSDELVVNLEMAIKRILNSKPELKTILEQLVTNLELVKDKFATLVKFEKVIDELNDIKDRNPDFQAKIEVVTEQIENIKDEALLTTQTEADLKKDIIIVPWDFSEIAENALQHAVQYAHIIGGYVSLLHVVKKAKEIPEATEKMKAESLKIAKKYNMKPDIVIREGNIFKTISEVAEERKAKLVIMGTHGIKGMQKVTGSWALKVIADSKPPFIVVQESPQHDIIKEVLFPVDHRKEIKYKLLQAQFLSKYYKIKFHICKPAKLSDKQFIRRVNNNLAFIKKYFNEHKIDYDIITVEGTSDFAEATLKLSTEIKPDLILILITKDIDITDFILGASEQRIIANESKIPVMCINPPHARKWSVSTGVTG